MKCEICTSESVPFKEKDEFILYRCQVCNFMQFDYKFAPELFKRIGAKIQTKHSKSNVSTAIQFQKYFNNKNILDVGCGVARLQQGMNSAGIKYKSYTNVDIPAVSKIAEYMGYSVIAGDVSSPSFIGKLPDIEFDTIIASHILEHVPYPSKVLDIWKRAMTEKTVIYIEVPTHDNLDMNREDVWLQYEHISYFSQKSFNDLMNDKFKVVESQERPHKNAINWYFIGALK